MEGEKNKRESEKQRDIDTEITQFSLLTTLKGKVFKCHGRVCYFWNIYNLQNFVQSICCLKILII